MKIMFNCLYKNIFLVFLALSFDLKADELTDQKSVQKNLHNQETESLGHVKSTFEDFLNHPVSGMKFNRQDACFTNAHLDSLKGDPAPLKECSTAHISQKCEALQADISFSDGTKIFSYKSPSLKKNLEEKNVFGFIPATRQQAKMHPTSLNQYTKKMGAKRKHKLNEIVEFTRAQLIALLTNGETDESKLSSETQATLKRVRELKFISPDIPISEIKTSSAVPLKGSTSKSFLAQKMNSDCRKTPASYFKDYNVFFICPPLLEENDLAVAGIIAHEMSHAVVLDHSVLKEKLDPYKKYLASEKFEMKDMALEENMADVLGAEILGRYIQNKKPSAKNEESAHLKPISTLMTSYCRRTMNNDSEDESLTEEASSNTKGTSSKSTSSTLAHAPAEKRIEYIYLNNPHIAEFVGCKPKKVLGF